MSRPQWYTRRLITDDQGRRIQVEHYFTTLEEVCPVCTRPLIAHRLVYCPEGCYTRPLSRAEYIDGALIITYDGKQGEEFHT